MPPLFRTYLAEGSILPLGVRPTKTDNYQMYNYFNADSKYLFQMKIIVNDKTHIVFLFHKMHNKATIIFLKIRT